MAQVVSGTNTFDYQDMYNVTGTVISVNGDLVVVEPNSLQNVLYPLYTSGGLLAVGENRVTIATLNVTVNMDQTPLRTSAEKNIDLTNLLPVHLEYSETGEFLNFFETYLNELYDEYVSYRGNNEDFTVSGEGIKTYYKTSADSSGDELFASAGSYFTSAGTITTDLEDVPLTYATSSSPSISILEKAKRISDLHDPDLIDIEYINQLASYFGYDIGVFRDDISTITTSLDDYDSQRYLRNIVTNLPHWYKIKATDNAIKILLYSFGIVATVVKKWTSDALAATSAHPTSGGYGSDSSLWISSDSDDTSLDVPISGVPDNYFPTPHFKIRINQALASPDWFNNIDKIFQTVESIRAINTVLDSIDTVFYQLLSPVAVRVDHYGRTKMVFGLETTSMSTLSAYPVTMGLNGSGINESFVSATDDLNIKWGIGFHPICASPVPTVDVSISYDNKATWTTVSADALNLVVSGAGTTLFTDSSAVGSFTSASWPPGTGDGSNSYVRVIEVVSGSTTGSGNASAFSEAFTVT